jgi:hypothetical protein
VKKILIYVGAALVVIYAAVCAFFYVVQDKLLYYPTPEVNRPGAKALSLSAGDATLKVWELHPDAQPALIYLGGNAEDVGSNAPDFDSAFPDRAVYLVNYRGYGGSTGQPSELALISDAQAVYDSVAAHHRGIVVVGRSLGTGVATALAASRPVERLILVTPFDSIAHVGADHYPWLPVRLLLRDQYNSLIRIGKVQAPVLAVAAERDEVVFRPRSDALIAAIPARQRHTLLIAGATHNDVTTFAAYMQGLKEFAAGQERSTADSGTSSK